MSLFLSYFKWYKNEKSLPLIIRPLHFYRDKKRKEAPQCICQKGSMTIEAAVLLPMMVCFFCFLLFYFRIMQVQIEVQNSLEQTVRTLAVLSVQELENPEERIEYLGIAKTLVSLNLSGQEAVKSYVTGGVLGVSLITSEFDADDIILKANYGIKFPVNLLGDKIFWITQKAQARKWLGWHSIDADSEKNRVVYVTRHGTVCHLRMSCPFLALSIEKVSKANVSEYRNKDGERYKACELCVTGVGSLQEVFITDYGNRYHCDVNCTSLRRTICKKNLSEVGGMETCPKCWK